MGNLSLTPLSATSIRPNCSSRSRSGPLKTSDEFPSAKLRISETGAPQSSSASLCPRQLRLCNPAAGTVSASPPDEWLYTPKRAAACSPPPARQGWQKRSEQKATRTRERRATLKLSLSVHTPPPFPFHKQNQTPSTPRHPTQKQKTTPRTEQVATHQQPAQVTHSSSSK